MNHSEINTIALAIERAIEQNHGNWNPTYADVLDSSGNKVGHIVCGYPKANNAEWDFYPTESLRKPTRRGGDSYATIAAKRGVKGLHLAVKRKHLLEVIPKWVGAYTISNVHTYCEMKSDNVS